MSTKYLGGVQPATRAICVEVLDYLKRNGTPLPAHPDKGEPVVWGKSGDPKNTEHYSGRALDFMCSESVGNEIVAYLWRHRQRLGLTHMIWRQRIKSTRVDPGVWRKQADRGSWTNNHMDHVHALFSGKSPGRAPADAGSAGSSAGSAPPFPLPRGHYFGPRSGPVSSVSGYYSHRADLRRWQAQMRRRGWRISADGLWGGQSASVLKAFQREKGLTVDGLLGPASWLAAWQLPIT